MADQNESSVLFSLKELMNLEQDRIAQEEAAKAQKTREAEEARQAALLAEERAREEKLRQEQLAQEELVRKQREDEARLEAIRQAELEKVKAEAEHRAQLETLAAQREHEAQLAKIQGQSSAKKTKIIAGLAITILALAVGGVGYQWYREREIARAEKIALETRIAEENQKHAEAMAAITEQREAIERQLSEAKSEAERSRLNRLQAENEAKARALNEQKAAATANHSPRRPSAARKPSKPKKRAAPKCNCDPSDPMCSCL